jgi:oligopeptide/dipeptide ABC transporter, ATP-binding protein, C-terminal domain
MNEQVVKILLEVRDLKKHFPISGDSIFSKKKFVHAVDGVNFTAKKGKTLGIVGESGCGKTTVGRMIVRLTPATSGEIFFEGRDILKYQKSEMSLLRRQIQFIFQDPYSSLNPKMKIREILGEPLGLYKIAKGKEKERQITELLEVVGLSKSALNRFPHEFSGGQRQRIGIARALSLKPKLIICDEPVSALDVSIQSQILNLLQELQGEFGLTYIFIAHGLNVIKHISDDVGVMYLGKMMELSPVDELFERPYHPYTQALMSAIPMPDPEIEGCNVVLKGELPSLIDIPDRCRFCTRCPVAKDRCFKEEPQLKEISCGRFVACHFVEADKEAAK